MNFRNVIALAVLVAVGSVHAADREKGKTKKPEAARASVVGRLACSKCAFKATENCLTALKLDDKQFVLLSGKAGKALFKSRCSDKLVRVSGTLMVKGGVATITSAKSNELKNQNARPRLSLTGNLVCSKCEFKIGECAAGLKAGELQVLLDGEAAQALFKARCSGTPKVATGALARIDGNAIYLKVTRVVDPGAVVDASKWQPMLARSFEEGAKRLQVNGVVVDRNVGCVFLSVEGKGVYCSSAGAGRFSPNEKTWDQVCELRIEDPQHKFTLTAAGIKESRDGGATWSKPIPLPEGFVVTSQTWLEYDARHDNLYVMNAGSDLYKLARGE